MKRKILNAKTAVKALHEKKEIYTIAVGNESAPDQRLEWRMVSMKRNFL